MSSAPRPIVILGSTGSIGTQALAVIADNTDRFTVAALAAGRNVELLAQQAVATRAPVVAAAVDDEAALTRALDAARAAAGAQSYAPEVVTGPDAASVAAATPAYTVVNGITGAIGLRPSLAALKAGSILALANKESLIIGGRLVTQQASPGQIVPVDSEHSAIAQCLRAGSSGEVARLVLTASGGPFRGQSREQLGSVTPAQALAHPTWDMGRVVTTNSATLVNKGLEVIEAHLLFDIPFTQIDVVVHPQSVVHSMVEFTDGSTIVQASPPSMLIPIALGMAWPERVPGAAPGCDWSGATSWEFQPLDEQAFPAVALARRVGQLGGSAPAVFNAANEVAVDAFHEGELSFRGIVDTVQAVVGQLEAGEHPIEVSAVEEVLAADAWARQAAAQLVSAN